MRVEESSILTAREGRTEQELSPAGWHDMIPREARPVCRTIFSVRLWWEFKKQQGATGWGADQSKTPPAEVELNEEGYECGRGRAGTQPAIDSGEISERAGTRSCLLPGVQSNNPGERIASDPVELVMGPLPICSHAAPPPSAALSPPDRLPKMCKGLEVEEAGQAESS